MIEDTLHQYPETDSEKDAMIRDAITEMVTSRDGMNHRCSGGTECGVWKAAYKAIKEVDNMGLIDIRRVRETGEVEVRKDVVAQALFQIAFDNAVERAQPAIMAEASF